MQLMVWAGLAVIASVATLALWRGARHWALAAFWRFALVTAIGTALLFAAMLPDPARYAAGDLLAAEGRALFYASLIGAAFALFYLMEALPALLARSRAGA